jgi:Tfp pilus assembly protein PilF
MAGFRMPDKSRVFLICLALPVFTFIVYEPVLHHEFIGFDDHTYVTGNQQVKAGLTREGMAWAFGLEGNSYWHPLTWLSHMLDCQLFGLAPGMHHLTGLVFHMANSLLLFLVLKRTTARLWLSAFVAALFALHPINVDSVAWVAERKSVLSTFFWMLALLSYIYYCKRPSAYRYVLVFLVFGVGLLAKPMLVTLPFVLILLDYWPLGRLRTHVSGLVLEKVPLLALSVVSVFFTYFPLEQRNRVISTETVPMVLRIKNALVCYVGYIRDMFWPKDLAIFYPYPEKVLVWKAVGALLFLVFVTVVFIWVLRQKRYLTTGWLWYIGTALPIIGLVQVGLWPAKADRWMYVPLIGLFIIVAWAAANILPKWRYRRMALGTSAITVIVVLAVCTRLQLRHWRNSVTIFGHALAIAPSSTMHNNMGLALQLEGSIEEAISHYRQALHLDPDHVQAHNNIGTALKLQGKLEEAVAHYHQVLSRDPNYAEAHYNLAIALEAQGLSEDSAKHYRQALQTKPDYAKAHNNLANILLAQGKVDEALEHYRLAVKIAPDNAEIRRNLENALKFKSQHRPD